MAEKDSKEFTVEVEKEKEKGKEKGTAAAEADAAAEEGQDVAPASGKKKKLLIILIVAVLVLAAGGAAAYFLLWSGDEPAGDEASEVAADEDEEAETEEEEQKAPALYYEIDKPFIINFSVNNRQRYLQINVAAMTREQDVIEAINIHLPTISNRLVMLFSAADFAVLQTRDGKEKLREDTLLAVQDVLQNEIGKPGVEQVYFVGFVLQ